MSRDPEIQERCPTRDCGWEYPIVVAEQSAIRRRGLVITKQPAGFVLRCPMCLAIYSVSPAGVKPCNAMTPQRQAPPKPAERDRPDPSPYPNLPADMAPLWGRSE